MHTNFKKGNSTYVSHSERRKNDIIVNKAKTTMFSEKSPRTLGPKIWNSLRKDIIKDLTFLQKFTEITKTW